MEKVNVKLDELLKLPMETLGKYTKMLKWEGFFFIILGIVAIAMPLLFSVAIEFILGSLFVIAGIGGLVRSFRAKSIPGAIFSTLLYLLFIGVGIALISTPLLGIQILALLMGYFFLVSGFLKMIFSFQVKPAKNWGWSFLDGVISIALGAIILAGWPSSAPWIIGLLAGIKLIFLGNSMIMIGRGLKVSADAASATTQN